MFQRTKRQMWVDFIFIYDILNKSIIINTFEKQVINKNIKLLSIYTYLYGFYLKVPIEKILLFFNKDLKAIKFRFYYIVLFS